MFKLLRTSDFEMHSMNQTLNCKFLQCDLKKKYRLKHPILKPAFNIHLKLKINLILTMQTDIRLKLSQLPFLQNQLGISRFKPP